MVLFFNSVPLAAQFKNCSLERIKTLHLYFSVTELYCMKCKESVLSVCISTKLRTISGSTHKHKEETGQSECITLQKGMKRVNSQRNPRENPALEFRLYTVLPYYFGVTHFDQHSDATRCTYTLYLLIGCSQRNNQIVHVLGSSHFYMQMKPIKLIKTQQPTLNKNKKNKAKKQIKLSIHIYIYTHTVTLCYKCSVKKQNLVIWDLMESGTYLLSMNSILKYFKLLTHFYY